MRGQEALTDHLASPKVKAAPPESSHFAMFFVSLRALLTRAEESNSIRTVCMTDAPYQSKARR
jgi:hypothetical protein